jgi:hypothetical protein
MLMVRQVPAPIPYIAHPRSGWLDNAFMDSETVLSKALDCNIDPKSLS